jgi:hypothetical protein
LNHERSLDWIQELKLLKNIEKKFSESDQILDIKKIKNQKNRLELLLNYTQDRIQLIDQPFHVRLMKIFAFIFYQKYYYYLGWRSLLKDITLKK